jgi:hypothetical protein
MPDYVGDARVANIFLFESWSKQLIEWDKEDKLKQANNTKE